MRIFIIVIFFAVAFPANVTLAASGEDSAMTVGIGVASCAQYAKAYQGNPDITGKFMMSWTQGYFSAMNQLSYGSGISPKNLAPLTEEYIIQSVNKFCADNPLKSWSDGALKLYNGLDKISDETRKALDKYNSQ